MLPLPTVSLPFDFDELARLARTDPAAFEARRQALLSSAVAEAPPALQAGLQADLAQVQVSMAGARDLQERLAVAFGALGRSVQTLQQRLTQARQDGDLTAPSSRRA